MTNEVVSLANKLPYKKQVISKVSGDYKEQRLPLKQSIVENLPVFNDPCPYKIGIGDQFTFS